MDADCFPIGVRRAVCGVAPRFVSISLHERRGNLPLPGEIEMRWWLIERWGFGDGLRRRGINFARYYFARARHATMRDMDIIRISERTLSFLKSSR